MKGQALYALVFAMILFVAPYAAAVSEDFANLEEGCYDQSVSETGLGIAINFGNIVEVTNRTQLTIVDSCDGGNEIDYTTTVNLVLGPIQPDEVIIEENFIYVDSVLRPDLNQPAQITFRNQPYSVAPALLKDGELCEEPDCVVDTYRDGTLTANVTGFSNYSLQGRQDFSLYSDEEPELHGKVYQVLDLGNSYRASEFACVVMIFAENVDNELVLVQTNPERKVQGRLFGDTDMQQPESLGYFPTRNGVANVYFRNDLLVGYTDFQYVAQCQNNVTQLIYEETIRPIHAPLGRNFASRAVWFTTDNDGENSFFLVFYIVALVLGIWIVLAFIRRTIGGP